VRVFLCHSDTIHIFTSSKIRAEVLVVGLKDHAKEIDGMASADSGDVSMLRLRSLSISREINVLHSGLIASKHSVPVACMWNNGHIEITPTSRNLVEVA
jgi:hypothetical protein